MIANYLKIAWRNLLRNKLFSFLNIFGFAIGLTCFMLIAAYVLHELSYDRYPARAGQIYRVELSATGNGDIAHYPVVDEAVGEGMKSAFSEIKEVTRFSPVTDYVKYEEKNFKEEHLAFADANFFTIFSIPLVQGSATTALKEPYSMVLSGSLAKKYFGDENPVGRLLTVGVNGKPYKVTGIYDRIPENSHFHFDALLSRSTWNIPNPTWSNLGPYTYLVLDEHADPRKLEAKFPQLVEKYVVPEVQHDMGVSLEEARKSVNTFVFTLQPLTGIHLNAHSKQELDAEGDIQYVYIFSALAIFVLLLACVNFTNLSMAKSARRSREVGIRKVVGSGKRQLIFQFLSESVLLTLLSLVIAYAFLFFLLPYFNQLSGKQISYGFFLSPLILSAVFMVSLLAGLLAGLYPAFFMSSFNITRILKGGAPLGGNARRPLRSSLVVFQFFVSTALIIATITVYRQLHFMQNKKLGFEKEQVLFLPDARMLGKNQDAFRSRLVEDSRVVAASITRSAPGEAFMDGTEIYPRNENGNGTEIHTNIYHVDYDFLSALGIKVIRGRNFSREFPTDSTSGILVNESAVQSLGWTLDNAIGKSIVRSGNQELKVIGVVNDFNYASVRQKIAPLVLMLRGNYGGLLLKVKTGSMKSFLDDLKKEWSAFNPPGPLEYRFLDEHFASLYAGEEQTQRIFSSFAVLAIIIACLGLFGLSAYTIEQRTREIGVRKVLGASVVQVMTLVYREFLVLVLIAVLVSVPVAGWFMHKWLEDFAYRTGMAWWVFAAAGLVALFIALATISYQAVKAALANPVKSLRTE